MASKANLVIDQGASFTTTISLTDEYGNATDLTGYTGESVIKKWYTSTSSVPFAVALTGTTGQVTLTLTAAQTAALDYGRYVYDVNLTLGSTISRVLEGIITVTPAVTNP
jgi:hypothetical protein